MTSKEVSVPALEAILFACPQPVPLERLAELLEAASTDSIHHALRELNERYLAQNRPYRVEASARGYRLELHALLQLHEPPPRVRRLSAATLETLAVVTYLQPITEAQVAARQGTNVRPALRHLCHLGWVRQQLGFDELEAESRYVTTPALLEQLGLSSLDDLPPPHGLHKI